MLDFAQVERTLRQLGGAEERRVTAERIAGLDPMLPLALLRERRHVDSVFAGMEGDSTTEVWPGFRGLVEAGISAVVGMLRKPS